MIQNSIQIIMISIKKMRFPVRKFPLSNALNNSEQNNYH